MVDCSPRTWHQGSAPYCPLLAADPPLEQIGYRGGSKPYLPRTGPRTAAGMQSVTSPMKWSEFLRAVTVTGFGSAAQSLEVAALQDA